MFNERTYPYKIVTTRYGTGGSKAFKHTLKLFNACLSMEVTNSQKPSPRLIERCEAGNNSVWKEGTIKDGFVYPTNPQLPLASQPRAATPRVVSQ